MIDAAFDSCAYQPKYVGSYRVNITCQPDGNADDGRRSETIRKGLWPVKGSKVNSWLHLRRLLWGLQAWYSPGMKPVLSSGF